MKATLKLPMRWVGPYEKDESVEIVDRILDEGKLREDLYQFSIGEMSAEELMNSLQGHFANTYEFLYPNPFDDGAA